MKKEEKISGWVSGGIIALIIYILILTTNIIPLLKFLYSIQMFFGNLLLIAIPSNLENTDVIPLFSFVIAPLVWFAGGALIGWLIDKHKKS